jgi:uncharacterized protein (TIGR02147 family)
MQRPSPFDFEDYRAFLLAWRDWAQEFRRNFSYRWFMRRANSLNTSLLPNVITGRQNISAQMLPGFIQALELNQDEGQYFTLLVQLERAEPEARRGILDRLRVLRRLHNAGLINGPIFRYLSEWYYVVIREMAACPDFHDDPVWISQRIRPCITVEHAADAMRILLELGLLKRDEHGIPRPSTTSIRTDDDALNEATRRYHTAMVNRSGDVLDEMSLGSGIGKRTRFLGLTVAIPRSRMPALIATLHEYQQNLLALCDEPGDPPDEVYQIALHLFPLTEEVAPQEPLSLDADPHHQHPDESQNEPDPDQLK